MKDIQYYLLIAMLATFSAIGVIGNTLVIVVFTRTFVTKSRNTSSHFIIALAFADLLACSLIMPSTIAILLLDGYTRFDLLCKAYEFGITSTIPFSAYLMAAISLDRYLCICHTAKRFMTPRRAKALICALVLLASGMAVPVALLHGVYSLEPEPVPENSTLPSRSGRYTLPSMHNSFVAGNHQPGWNGSFPTSAAIVPVKEEAKYTGYCQLNSLIIHYSVIPVYKKVHLSMYLLSVSIVAVFYALIYSYVVKHRKVIRLRRSHMNIQHNIPPCTGVATFHNTMTPKRNSTRSLKPEEEKEQEDDEAVQILLAPNPAPADGSSCDSRFSRTASFIENAAANQVIRDFLKDVKLAAMLFIVAVIFVVCYMPAALIINFIIPNNLLAFYTYFFVNVVNPFIYSFLNESFRTALKQLLCRQPSI